MSTARLIQQQLADDLTSEQKACEVLRQDIRQRISKLRKVLDDKSITWNIYSAGWDYIQEAEALLKIRLSSQQLTTVKESLVCSHNLVRHPSAETVIAARAKADEMGNISVERDKQRFRSKIFKKITGAFICLIGVCAAGLGLFGGSPPLALFGGFVAVAAYRFLLISPNKQSLSDNMKNLANHVVADIVNPALRAGG